MPGMVLGTGNIAMNNIDNNLNPPKAYILVEGEEKQK